jgi:hypothetical protein
MELAMDSGVKVVGAAPTEEADSGSSASKASRHASSGLSMNRVVLVVAVLGMIGTFVFGGLWLTKSGGSSQQDRAVLMTTRTFLKELTNFNAKSVDADFTAITNMATGSFASQAQKFFNSAIRTDLEKALADTRGQVRSMYVQTFNTHQASVYGIVDELYANNKITTPQADVLRLLVNLKLVGTTWKISNVTVLEGATPASAGSASGSAGSVVPGQ